MVKNGQQEAVRRLRYEPPGETDVGVEVITFARLRGMPAGSTHPPVQRADFHVLAIIGSGDGVVTVDFVHHRLEPRTIVWIRPARVHRWDDIAAVDGTLVLFRPESVPQGSPGADPLGPVRWRQAARAALVRIAADHLRREHDEFRTRPLPGSAAILSALLAVLLARASDGAPPPAAGRDTFTAYAAAVDAHYASSREVTWYARRLGYSPRTLSRATHEAVGRSAKQFIDDRVVLEAKRLLAHTDITVAECARRTGFDDPANFSKFFRARAGRAPGAFAAYVKTGRTQPGILRTRRPTSGRSRRNGAASRYIPGTSTTRVPSSSSKLGTPGSTRRRARVSTVRSATCGRYATAS
jgi:AraC-like DNA-binding protein